MKENLKLIISAVLITLVAHSPFAFGHYIFCFSQMEEVHADIEQNLVDDDGEMICDVEIEWIKCDGTW